MSWIWSWAKSKMVPADLGLVDNGVKFVLEGEKRRAVAFRLDKNAEFATRAHLADAQRAGYRTRLNQWFDRTDRGLTPTGKLSQEDIEMLRSLGYIE